MVHVDCVDAYVQAPEDERGGNFRAGDAHHGVVPAGGREHHDRFPSLRWRWC